MSKVLVTGGAGFIGSFVVEALLKRNHYVRVLDNLDPQVHGERQEWPTYLTRDAELIIGDVRDHDTVATALAECDAVIHLAAAVGVGQSMYKIEHYCDVNVIGTAVLLEEMLKVKGRFAKLIVASSMSIYGEGLYVDVDGNEVTPRPRSLEQMKQGMWEVSGPDGQKLQPIATPESKPLQPTSIYAVNKRDQEEMCLSFGHAYDIPTVAMRMFNVYGPRQALSNPYTGVCAIFSSRLLSGGAPLIFEDGEQMRDFVNVEDVAEAYAVALENSGADGLALNIGSGQRISVNEIAKILIEKLRLTFEPKITHQYRQGDIRHCFSNIELTTSTLPWKPKHSFTDGVIPLLDWLASQSSDHRVSQAYQELKKHGLVQ